MDVKRLNDAAEEAGNFLKAMAEPGRLRILCLLSAGECSVSTIAETLGAPQSSISRQLSLLRKDKIVAARSNGTTRYYRIADARAERLIEVLYECFCNKNANSGL